MHPRNSLETVPNYDTSLYQNSTGHLEARIVGQLPVSSSLAVGRAKPFGASWIVWLLKCIPYSQVAGVQTVAILLLTISSPGEIDRDLFVKVNSFCSAQ